MDRRTSRTLRWPTLLLAATLLTAAGCSRQKESPASTAETPKQQVQAQEGETLELGNLPHISPEEATEVFIQELEQVTALDENVAVHVKLPPPINPELEGSLVRVLGQPESPTLMFRSDALAGMGVIASSPGSEFYTLFTRLEEYELDRRIWGEELLASGAFGDTTENLVLFKGRSPVAITQSLPFDRELLAAHLPMSLSHCPAVPTATEQGWGESLFITSTDVVLNQARTWDPCSGDGTPGGVWTFGHLMRELATDSGSSPEDFVLEWLKLWLKEQTVNDDVVPERGFAMYNQVIEPWANASGASAAVVPVNDGFDVIINGQLDVDKAPFRLLAIVNRLDLGKTTQGSSGYGGAMTSTPVDAGELRFIFGVVQPWGGGSCDTKDFTVIFEYEVPIQGCGNVTQWARDWTELNTFGGFTQAYLQHLESLTERVVLNGLGSGKGNNNTLKQIRTNDKALDPEVAEMREFTLTDEDPETGIDTPSNGLLRVHTVAQTPDDARYPWDSDPTVDNYVMNQVRISLPTPVSLPDRCSSTHNVPYKSSGAGFRGGNSFIEPRYWKAVSAVDTDDSAVCARHQFSFQTCNGCHSADTQTDIRHVSTSGFPTLLSRFLTGGGPGNAFLAQDPWATGKKWPFSELQDRWTRLYKTAYCVPCGGFFSLRPEFLEELQVKAGGVPIDPIDPLDTGPFEVKPIWDSEDLWWILENRGSSVAEYRDEPLDFIRPAETFVH